MKVGIVNVTGYAGMELARLLYRHPEVELTCVTGRSAAGKKLGDVLPHLADIDLTITEDLTEAARAVRCPVVLVVGDRDRETPPELAMRLNRLMPHSRLVVLRGFDHWNVLTDGRHQITQRLAELMEQLA